MLSTSVLLFWIATTKVIGVTSVTADNLESSNKRGDGIVAGQVVSGSYLIQLADATDARTVRATAVQTAAKMQAVKQSLIAAGTLSTSDDVTNTQVSTSLIFTESIKGFVMSGVSEEISDMLLKASNVIRVEPDKIVSIHNGLDNGSRQLQSEFKHRATLDSQGNRLMESKNQILPWGIKRVGGPIKSNPNTTGRVFIIDTGIAPVEDLNIDKSLSINFADWYTEPKNPLWYDGFGHGTHVAGIVAALNNDINVVGVVPGAPVVAVRVLDEYGFGFWSTVIAGIEYVATKGKAGDVANLSLGGYFSDIVNAAVEKAAAKGIKFSIAAGNSNDDAQYYSPASASGENIYTVSCYDNTDSLCYFSNYGSPVDFSGPGLDVESLTPDGGTAIYSGTSMSTPHIAGLLLAGSIRVGGYVKCDKDSVPDPIAVASLAPVSPTPAPSMPPANRLIIKIMTDGYASTETAWTLHQLVSNTRTLIASKAIGAYGNYMLYTEKIDLAMGDYLFNFTDAFGDGIFFPGEYSVTLGDKVLKKSGNFTYFEAFNFTVGQKGPTVAPTLPPVNQLDFTMMTDTSGYEIGWSLFQIFQNSTKLILSKPSGTYGSEQLYTEQYYLDLGKYQFNLTDDWSGNGLLCPGYYTISLGGVVLKRGGAFQYVDSTMFTVASVPANQFYFTILTDAFALEDTAWTLYQILANQNTLIASKEIGSYGNNMPYTERYLLGEGTYQFNVTDAYGDGITRPGYYTLSLGGTIIKTSRPFTYLDSTTFTVGAMAPSPFKPLPKPVAPVVIKPAPTKPLPTKPAPAKPSPTKPAPAKPSPTKPAPANPLPTKPAPANPLPTKTVQKKVRIETHD